TNAGLVSPSMKTTWDGKQDALGFTPYNATNPSGYQTLAQVNAKISDDAWEVGAEGLTNIASSQNAVFNGIANVFVYAEYLDDNKQPIADVLSNTTASFTTANETKLDGIATGATANDTDANLKARANHTGTQTASTISDLNSVSRAQTEAELLAGANITITPSGTGASRQLTIASTGGSSAIGAFKMLANNTNASAVPTEQVYKDVAEQSLSGTGMIATGGALPTGTNTHFFRWSQKGNLVTVRINLQFQTAGTCSGIAIPFANMADIPQIPQHANIYAGAGDVIIYGAGNLNNTKTFPLFTTAMGLSGIRIKTIGTPNTYEFVVGRTSSSYNNGWIHIQYYI
ncbi:hypothetical protein, partial [Flavobacterium sp.]|uniref:hypothetical protein n=1 Tax=Flavobacterium sp. TaxID=239 RepID=UPI0038FD3ED2